MNFYALLQSLSVNLHRQANIQTIRHSHYNLAKQPSTLLKFAGEQSNNETQT